MFNCTLEYGKALRLAKLRAAEMNSTLSRVVREVPPGLCTGKESVAKLSNTYSDVSQLRITYRSVIVTQATAKAITDASNVITL